MDPLTVILVQLAELLFLVTYGVSVVIQLHKRNKAPHSLDTKMNIYGRVILWSAVIGITLITKNISDGTLYVVFLAVLLVFFVVGSRLWVHSYKIKDENKETFYYAWDQWVIKIYKKYLQPTGK